MFSGIVESLGYVTGLELDGVGCRLGVEDELVGSSVKVADSVAVNGCCLTVVKTQGNKFEFQAGPETLSRTNLGCLAIGSRVNLERALSVGDRLGGHFVSGHIDGQGELVKVDDLGDWQDYYFKIPYELSAQMASKGSVTVDGVSLTIVTCKDGLFSVALIPYTLKVTTLGIRKIGDKVNIETDILAKYVQRLYEYKDKDIQARF
ncbi:MAG: riboflavin synthase [Planctomycetaceae bacterium]|jgi:riboflavin synthase|nr:riboflavin synthase [Planctomycetaceae bacterium]